MVARPVKRQCMLANYISPTYFQHRYDWRSACWRKKLMSRSFFFMSCVSCWQKRRNWNQRRKSKLRYCYSKLIDAGYSTMWVNCITFFRVIWKSHRKGIIFFKCRKVDQRAQVETADLSLSNCDTISILSSRLLLGSRATSWWCPADLQSLKEMHMYRVLQKEFLGLN